MLGDYTLANGKSEADAFGLVAHGLAGAAGTFGYGELGDIAIEIDDAIVKGEAVAVEDIARLLVALEQALGMPRRSA